MGRKSNAKWKKRWRAFALADTVTKRLHFILRFGHHRKFRGPVLRVGRREAL